jgi:hypothetical protein
MPNIYALVAAALAAALLRTAAQAAPEPPRYAVIDRIPGPGGGYDYLAVDSAAGRLFSAKPEILVVCPAPAQDCRFVGGDGIQAAVDAARDGDIVRLRAGRYTASRYRDTSFQDLQIRGFVVVTGKRLAIEGDDGAVLDGSDGPPTSAFVLDHADVTLGNLTIRNFRFGEPEDKVYDGHGVFAIDSRVRLDRIRMERIAKMALTGRGDTLIDASDIRLLDGHMGVWLEESAHAHIRNAVIRGGDSAAIGAYGEASVHLYNSVIQGNGDDGLYAKGHGAIFATNSLVIANRPFGLNAEEDGRIAVAHSVVYGNAADYKPGPAIRLGAGVLRIDPQLDGEGRPRPGSPIAGVRDPESGRPIGLIARPGAGGE